MHYNQFTIDYITAIQRNLGIEINNNGEAIFVFDKINRKNIIELKNELDILFEKSTTSINILENKIESTIQAGLFGLVDDMDKAIKIGFLLADRVVLIDYLYERILTKDIDKIDYTHLGSVSVFLVQLLALAKNGRIVIIQNPFNWHLQSKKIIREVSEKTDLTPQLMSMLNMLSITRQCKLHPYTIAESNDEYKLIIESQIDKVDIIGKDGDYAYEGILGALLSEKLFNNTELKIAFDIPINKYYQIVSANKEFYKSYLSRIISNSPLSSEVNIDKLRKDLEKDIKDYNKRLPANLKHAITSVTGVSAGSIAVLSAITVISAPIILTGAFLGLSGTLFGILKSRKNEPIISVFNNILNE